MGFVLTTLSAISALLNSLGVFKQLCVSQLRKRIAGAYKSGRPSFFVSQRFASTSHQDCKATADDGIGTAKGSLANQAPVEVPIQRPLRGNWPFTVRPPVHRPAAPLPLNTIARRSFLPISVESSRRNTFLASLGAEVSGNAPARVVKRVSDVRSGRLVIAGRMADVCAELDRMVAFEALQN